MDFLGHAMGAAQVLGPHTRSKAVIAIVGVADDFFFAVERSDGDDWAENFFAICAAGDGKIDNDSWGEKIALTTALADDWRRFAAEGDSSAFLLGKIDIELHVIELCLADDCALLS